MFQTWTKLFVESQSRGNEMNRSTKKIQRGGGVLWSKILPAIQQAIANDKFAAVMCVRTMYERESGMTLVKKFLGSKCKGAVDRIEKQLGAPEKIHLVNGSMICIALVDEIPKHFPHLLPKLMKMSKVQLDEQLPVIETNAAAD